MFPLFKVNEVKFAGGVLSTIYTSVVYDPLFQIRSEKAISTIRLSEVDHETVYENHVPILLFKLLLHSTLPVLKSVSSEESVNVISFTAIPVAVSLKTEIFGAV